MPGKVNPVIPEVVTQVAAQVIGNDARSRSAACRALRAERLRPADGAQPARLDQAARAPSRLFAEKCVDGIEANREQCERYAELTLSAATALNPYIGYDKAPRSSRRPPRSGRSLREVARERASTTRRSTRRSTTADGQAARFLKRRAAPKRRPFPSLEALRQRLCRCLAVLGRMLLRRLADMAVAAVAVAVRQTRRVREDVSSCVTPFSGNGLTLRVSDQIGCARFPRLTVSPL
jgi:hypothetical protein